jgi:hypothetical protein
VNNAPTIYTDPFGLQVKNFWPMPVLVKDETDAGGFHWVPGANDGKPGRYDHPIDGVCLPGPDGPRWYKVPDGTDVTIHSDGSATRSHGPYNWIPDFPDLPIFDRFPGWKREPDWSRRQPNWKYPPDDPSRDPDRNRPPGSGRKDPPPPRCGS